VPEAARGRRYLGRYFLLAIRWLGRPRRLLGIGILALLVVGAVLLGRRLWAQHELQVGRELLAGYHPYEAWPHLEACLRLWPDKAEALLLLARAARRGGLLDVGDHYLEEYQRRHGQTEDLALEQILQAAARGEVDRVGKYCKDLVRQDSPAAPLALEAMVQGYCQTYRLTEAFGALRVWLAREPDNTQALLFDAGLKALLLHYDDALDGYNRILELDPEHDTARMRLATLQLEQLKAAEAAPHLERLRQRQPDNSAVAVVLARCRAQLAQQAEAEQLLEEVLARDPHFGPALAERGRLALSRGQSGRAETWLREALAQDPGNHRLRYHLAQCLSQNGKKAEAEAENRLVEKLARDMKRLETITTAEMQQRPHDPALHHELGLLMLDRGQVEEAVLWLQRALKENPTYVPAHQTLAEYYRKVGDQERAAYHRRFLPTAPPAQPAATP
jgi:predicted Zn-dependent protease